MGTLTRSVLPAEPFRHAVHLTACREARRTIPSTSRDS